MGLILTEGSEPIPGYRLIKKLGEGGFGEVWKAEAPGGGHVAQKFIKLQTACSESELRALEIIRDIAHPNLLDVQRWDQVEQTVVITMPLCDQTLWDRLQQCRKQTRMGIPRDELMRYMEELAKAVDYLNDPRLFCPEETRDGIQHRDIKPHNIFLAGGSVRLADFGLAKFVSGDLASHTGSMSLHYVAPEALEGVTAPQSDQYSLALTYVNLLCGKLPFAGSTHQEVIYNHLYREPDLSGLGGEEFYVVRRALSKKPADRWPSCTVFVAALKAAQFAGVRSAPARDPGEGGETLALGQLYSDDTTGPGRVPFSRTGAPNPGDTNAGHTTVPDTGAAADHPAARLPATEAAELSAAALAPHKQRVRARTVGLVVAVPVLATVCLAVWFSRGDGAGSRGNGQTAVAIAGTSPAGPRPAGADPTTRADGPGVDPRAAAVGRGKASDGGKVADTKSAGAVAEGGGVGPAQRGTGGTATTAPETPLAHRVLRFVPPLVKVEIDGVPRRPDDEGRVIVEGTGDAPVRVTARAEGFKDLALSVRAADWKGPDTIFRLEPEEVAPGALNARARDVLARRCHGCHGVEFQGPALDVLDRDSLVQTRDEGRAPFVVPGESGRSALWEAVGVRGHPDSGAGAAPTEAEKLLLRRWIDSGANFPAPPRRPFRSERHLLAAIREHLHKAPKADRKYLRFFSLTNLHDAGRLGADEVRLARAAVSKLVNSLSWEPELVVPTCNDPDGLYLCVDLGRLGWDKDGLWQELLKAYPYGLTHDAPDDPAREVWEEIHSMTEEDVPYLRADWFVWAASRPPLYHTLLRLPTSAQGLESLLKVDAERDSGKAPPARAGIAKSRVSGRPQVIERYGDGAPAYWKAYDFQPGQSRGDDFKFPLRPKFAPRTNPRPPPSPSSAQILFQLPNGLQAYMLTDDEGARVYEANPNVAADPLRSSGSSALVNGVSCLACHRRGVLGMKDEISAAAGQAGAGAKALDPPHPSLHRTVEQDQARFVSAQARTMDPFLKADGAVAAGSLDVPEPISALARWYGKALGTDDLAAELGVEDAAAILAKIQGVPRLRKLGLEPLLTGGKIARAVWHDCFEQVVIELELGTPHRTL